MIPDVEWEAIVRALREQTLIPSNDGLVNGMNQLDINADFISSIEQNQHDVIDPFLYLALTTEIEEEGNNNNSDKQKKRWPQTKTTALVPISPDRKGSPEDVSVPYSLELWRKAKTLNRDRSVFGCTLAHLIAMKKLVGDGSTDQEFDFILEDNVRAFVGINVEDVHSSVSCSDGNDSWTGWSCECANRIWDAIELSGEMGKDNIINSDNLSTCHLRYFGWLGSLPNLSWVYDKHIPRKGDSKGDVKIFPFPTNDDFELDSIRTDKESVKLQKKTGTKTQQKALEGTPNFITPGGTAVFGTFAYTISQEAYHSLLVNLQNDVGALMWKSKKMRAYHAKPIDKILPRHIRSTFGEKCVHLPDKVAFVRCPMLGSLLHPQWEEGFCESTELQYSLSLIHENAVGPTMNSVWDCVWLTKEERHKVEHRATKSVLMH